MSKIIDNCSTALVLKEREAQLRIVQCKFDSFTKEETKQYRRYLLGNTPEMNVALLIETAGKLKKVKSYVRHLEQQLGLEDIK